MSGPDESRKPESVAGTKRFFRALGTFDSAPEVEASQRAGFYSGLIRALIRADRVERGRVTCSFTVKPAFVNAYKTLHGGVVAAVAETVALACAKTVAGDKEFFIGETSTSYLSAARLNAEVEVDGHVLRHGKRVIVTSVDLRIKKTGRLLFHVHCTVYCYENSNLSLSDDKAEVEVDGHVLRHGKRVIVTSVDLRIKKTGRLVYTSRATFYIMPAASL